MSIFTHYKNARNAANTKARIRNLQSNALKLQNKLMMLYKTVDINDLQKIDINLLHVELQKEQRELAEKYMEKEIKIIEDLAAKYQLKSPELLTKKT